MVRSVLAPNPGPMTLEGTNTWLLGRERVLVVDPGPADDGHLAHVLAEVAREGGRLAGVVLTHRHGDHADALGSPVLRSELRRRDLPVLAADPALGDPPDGATVAACTDVAVSVLRVPGHTDDSVALVLPGERAVCTGDTVLGRGPSVVAHPEGDLTAYLASLGLLAGVLDDGGPPWRGLPGHGPELPDLVAAVLALREHRLGRLEQVRAALGDERPGPGEPSAKLLQGLLRVVYPDLADPVLQQAALRTLRATLAHLQRQGGR